MLSETDQRRSEIQFVQLFHTLFPVLNAFTLPVDFLFDGVLRMPILDPKSRTKAVSLVKSYLDAHRQDASQLVNDENVMAELQAVTGATDRRILTSFVVPEALSQVQQPQTPSVPPSPNDAAQPEPGRKSTAKRPTTETAPPSLRELLVDRYRQEQQEKKFPLSSKSSLPSAKSTKEQQDDREIASLIAKCAPPGQHCAWHACTPIASCVAAPKHAQGRVAPTHECTRACILRRIRS